MAKLVAVVIAYNRADFVGVCAQSILNDATDDITMKVIVMDNGSSDGTAEAAQAVDSERVVVRRTEENRHFVTVVNEGLEEAFDEPDVEYVVIMNEDTQYTPGSLRKLVEACDTEPTGIFTALQVNYREPGRIDDNAFRDIQTVRPLMEDSVLGRDLRQMYPLPTIIGACLLARVDVWRNIGLWDPVFMFYGVDDDFCKRAKWLGHENWLVPEAQLLHAHGKIGVERKKLDKESEMRKWRTEMHAMFVFMLKDPDRSLSANYYHATITTILKSLRFLFVNPWPKGAIAMWVMFFRMIGLRNTFSVTRRQHFDASRKVGNRK